jgi:hypothetical protein
MLAFWPRHVVVGSMRVDKLVVNAKLTPNVGGAITPADLLSEVSTSFTIPSGLSKLLDLLG